MNGQTLNHIIQRATKFLTENKIDNARLDAEILLAHVLNENRIYIYINSELTLNEQQCKIYNSFIKRRAKHEPLAYIIGHKEFMNLDFIVTDEVLIPRPETEILVEETVERLKKFSDMLNIADIGIGSGAIGISILKLLINAHLDAVDISTSAIEIAKLNAVNHYVEDRINFHIGNLLSPLTGKKFNAIVSNPPYIPNFVIDSLQPEISNYEPRIALDGGADGLKFYRQLINDSPNLLIDGGFLAVEIGINQSNEIKNLIKNNEHFNHVEIINDLAGIERVMIIWKQKL